MDRWSIVDTYYWWLSEHYSGQGSREYARLCKVTGYFRPGALARGPEDIDGYIELCLRAGCSHERREDTR